MPSHLLTRLCGIPGDDLLLQAALTEHAILSPTDVLMTMLSKRLSLLICVIMHRSVCCARRFMATKIGMHNSLLLSKGQIDSKGGYCHSCL